MQVGNYEILEKIGQGAMGAVYRARQLSMDRIVALKVLSPRLSGDQAYVQRFEREARSAGQLDHPNLIRVYEVGVADDLRYFSMEFVGGPTLAKVLLTRGPLTEKTAIDCMTKIASALGAAHRKGIVHRDVKPENILLTAQGEPKLADLGLAKSIGGGAGVTASGAAVGTPHYMSPEQTRGESIDGRSDLYSLGATFFHMLTGRTVFDGATSPVVMVKHATEKPRHVRDIHPAISPGLDTVIDTLLAKRREDRYPDAKALIEDLEAVRDGRAPRHAALLRERPHAAARVHARPATRGALRSTGTARRPGRLPLVFAAAGAAILALVIALALPPSGDAEPPRPAPPSAPPSAPAEVATRPVQPREDAAARALAEVTQFVEEHPEDVAQALERLRDARDAAAGTGVAAGVDRLASDLERRWDQRALAALEAAEDAARECAARLDFDGARARIESVATPWRQRLSARWDAARDRVRAQAHEAIGAQVAAAEAALARGDLDAARAALAQLREARFATAAAELSPRVAGISQRLARADGAAREDAARAARDRSARLVAELLDRLLAGEYQVAREAAGAASADPAYGAGAAALRDAAGVAAEFVRREKVLEASLRQRIGGEVTLATDKGPVRGELVEVAESGPTVVTRSFVGGRAAGEARRQLEWRSLTRAQCEEIAAQPPAGIEAWRPDGPHGRVALAVLALADRDYAAAEAALDGARGHALEAVIRGRITGVRRDAAEAAARSAWEKDVAPWLERAGLAPEAGRQLAGVLDAYAAAHGATEFAKGRAEIEELRARAARAQVVEFVANGGFERELDEWKVVRGAPGTEVALVSSGPYEGKACVSLRARALIAQTLSLEPGTGYRLGFSVRWTRLVGDDDDVVVYLDEGKQIRWYRDGGPSTWTRVEFVFVAAKPDHVLKVFAPLVHPALVDGISLAREPKHILPGATEEGGHYYCYVDTPVSWHIARGWCEALGGHLVTISSFKENAFLRRLVRDTAWTGLSDAEKEGTWTWITGEPLTYENWYEGEPDNGDEDANEHYMAVLDGGRWLDYYVGAQHGFVVEWEPAPARRR